MAAALEFRKVDFSYDRSTPIIENASFELDERESICVVGPNGGGKSTLIHRLHLSRSSNSGATFLSR